MTPHNCPTCGGRQTVPGSFYGDRGSSAPCAVTCRTCNGAGIVWEPEYPETIEASPFPEITYSTRYLPV